MRFHCNAFSENIIWVLVWFLIQEIKVCNFGWKLDLSYKLLPSKISEEFTYLYIRESALISTCPAHSYKQRDTCKNWTYITVC